HMSSVLQTLLDALDAKPLGNDRFAARSIEYLRPRVFGGEPLAQGVANGGIKISSRFCAAHLPISKLRQSAAQLAPGTPFAPAHITNRRSEPSRHTVTRLGTSTRNTQTTYLSAKPSADVLDLRLSIGRSGEIRTPDPLLPK